MNNSIPKIRILRYLLIVINIGLIITGVLININVKCPACHMVPFLPINDVELGILGVSSNIVLGVLLYFANKKTIKYITFFFLMFLSGFSSFLQIGKYILSSGYCVYCLSSTIVFYVLFGTFLYQHMFKPLSNNINLIRE